MMKTKSPKPTISLSATGLLLLGCLQFAPAAEIKEIPLNASGEKLLAEYTQELETLGVEIAAELPTVDAQKKAAFETARTELGALKAPRENDAEAVHKAYQTAKPLAEEKALESAKPLIADLASLLTSDALDSKLMRAAILRHGTPRGLAEFAQQGAEEKGLLDKLFADRPLMRQILRSGGANGGE
ncbi:MAG: hypothetical protein P8J87_19260, partial [Verrucomicrobiales bacterium]|nr:hypothetical protein [Verrucomicrobiales bacterium]